MASPQRREPGSNLARATVHVQSAACFSLAPPLLSSAMRVAAKPFLRSRPVLLVAALVAPALLLAAAMIWQAYRNEKAAVADTLLGETRAIARLLDATIGQCHTLIQGIAASDSIARGDLTAIDRIARRAFRTDDRWFVLLAPDGQQVVNTRLPPGTALPRIEFEPELLQTVQRQQPYVSELKRGRATNELVLHVSQPHFEQGALKYILSVTLTPANIAQALSIDKLDPSRLVTIVDRRGMIIARNRNAEKFVGRLAAPDAVAAVVGGREGTWDATTIEKLRVLAAFTRAQCGWSAMVGAPKSDLHASATRLFIWAVVCVGLTTLVAIGMALALSRAHHAEAQLRVAQERISDHARELERSVEARTASLQQAVRQLEEFSYTVSHDLRAPLRTIRSFARVLVEDFAATLPAEAQEHLRRIELAGARLDRMTTDLLDYSRVARTEVQLERTDVDAIVREVIAQYPQLQPPLAEVRVYSPLEPVLAQPPLLHQCLSNLLWNAAKFVRPGERPSITVRMEARGEFRRIWVEDRGIGIPRTQQPKLFRVFERLHGQGKYEGTGVGLAIVRQAAEKMNGRCGVESDGINGSKFWIELRAVEAAVAVAGA